MFIKQTMDLTKAGLQRSQLTKLPFHFDSKRHLSQLASFDFSGNFFSQSDTILLVGMASLIGKNFDEHCFHFHDAPDKWPSWLSAPPKLVDWVHFSFSRVIPKTWKTGRERPVQRYSEVFGFGAKGQGFVVEIDTQLNKIGDRVEDACGG